MLATIKTAVEPELVAVKGATLPVRYLTPDDLAAMLSKRRNQIYQYARNGTLPAPIHCGYVTGYTST